MRCVDYDLDYQERMLREYAASAETICQRRWLFVAGVIGRFERPTVLDYGCGCGWFRAWRPERVGQMDTYDIAPVAQTGIRLARYDLVTFWDVLEHLATLGEVADVLAMTPYVAATIPIKPPATPWGDWKHFKPGEHLRYYTFEDLEAAFAEHGFALLERATIECPPRVDIVSFLFERRQRPCADSYCETARVRATS